MSDDERKYFAMHPSGGASHGDAHGNEEEAEQPLTPIDRPLDLAAVRAKLGAKTGKQYWRTLDELAEDPHFDELMHREFPRHASEWDESVDRRNFLKLMGASLAFAGIAGCKSNEQESIIPYVKQPDGMVLGKPLYFATVMPFGADAIGVLVESHEGRPTNLAGNPDHPSSLGGLDAFTQASILNLYDPDRAKTVSFAGSLRTWSEFSQAAQAAAADIKARERRGLPHPDGHHHFADAWRTVARNPEALSAGEVAPVGVGGQRRRARRRQAGLRPLYQHGVPPRARRSDFVARFRFPRQRPRAHFAT